MWRLLVVLALCGASLAQEENHAVSCNNITPLQNVSLTELQGTWVGRKSFDWNPIIDFPGSSICLLNEISIISKSSLKMEFKIDLRLKEEEGVITERRELEFIGDSEGKFKFETTGIEIWVLSSNSSSYLVAAHCHPQPGNHKYNAIGNRFLRTVYIFARRQGSGGSGNLSEEYLAKIIDDTVKTLGLENYSQEEKYETDC